VRRGVPIRLTVAWLAAACASEPQVAGPLEIRGWIDLCETRCNQEADCAPEELLFYHGDLDNCLYDCGYYLERDEHVAFVEETPDECLEALYAQVSCVFHLGCDQLSAWEDAADGTPCDETTAAADAACDGIDAEAFLLACGWPPEPPDGA
jgi:hypothetical protein